MHARGNQAICTGKLPCIWQEDKQYSWYMHKLHLCVCTFVTNLCFKYRKHQWKLNTDFHIHTYMYVDLPHTTHFENCYILIHNVQVALLSGLHNHFLIADSTQKQRSCQMHGSVT